MKKILFLYGVIWGLLISYSAQSKEYECDVGNGKKVTSAVLNMGDGVSGHYECKKGKLYVACSAGIQNLLPECDGKEWYDYVEVGNGDPVAGYAKINEMRNEIVQQNKEKVLQDVGACTVGNRKMSDGYATKNGNQGLLCLNGKISLINYDSNGNILENSSISEKEACKYLPGACDTEEQFLSEPSATVSSESAQTTPPDAGKILDTKTESGKKTDLSNQSVTASTKQPTIDGTAAMQNETGKTTSGNVEKSSFVGASNLGDDYGMGDCGSGNIFQQLACRAGVIGSGLKTVGYMIAGFGLIVFSFAAIFGKVKWPLFATIAFSCFLLSATVFVVNMMTKNGDASWIGGIKSGGFDYSSTAMPKGNVDEVAVTKETM